ncbi:hypothetical protein HK098_006592 [Nowakowskiella sp. JEL0407]|nr:hypothetical protein HK098_006592 [Nowakowskiella sp. JEL0407]
MSTAFAFLLLFILVRAQTISRCMKPSSRYLVALKFNSPSRPQNVLPTEKFAVAAEPNYKETDEDIDNAEESHFKWMSDNVHFLSHAKSNLASRQSHGNSSTTPASKRNSGLDKKWRIGKPGLFRGYGVYFSSVDDCVSFMDGIRKYTAQLNGTLANSRVHAVVDRIEEDVRVSLDPEQSARTRNVSVSQTADGTKLNQQFPPWGLDRIGQRNLPLDGLYQYASFAGEGVDAYIVDTGININHQDFQGRAVWGTTKSQGSADVDIHGHGSHVAGTIGGFYSGVAKKVRLIAVKVLDDEGGGSYSELIDGLQWVSEQVARSPEKANRSVVNLSVQGRTSEILNQAIIALNQLGVHIVAAAGNNGVEACGTSPSSATPQTQVISVGATDDVDQVPQYSNFGPCVNILAPGKQIVSVDAKTADGFKELSGTSMASPHVAGSVALLLSYNQSNLKTPQQMKSFLLQQSTKNVIRDTAQGQWIQGSFVNYAGMLYLNAL